MLADETTYTDTPFTKDCYEVYANEETALEDMIAEMERRRKVYVGE